MPMERGGIELGQEKDAFEAGVQAIGDRDIHNAILAGQRDGRFGAIFGQREETGAGAATEDDRQDAVKWNWFVRSGRWLLHG